MKPNCLYFGHSRALGTAFCKQYSEQLNIVGYSRSENTHAHVNLRGDVTTTDFSSLLKAYDSQGGFKHIVYAPNWCKWVKLAELDDGLARYGYDVGVFSLLRMLKAVATLERRPESICVVSSISAYGAWGETQIVYGSMKAAQTHVATYAAKLLGETTRVTCLAPNSFPQKVATEVVASELYTLLTEAKGGTVKVMR